MPRERNPMGFEPLHDKRRFQGEPGAFAVIYAVKGPERAIEPGVIAKTLRRQDGQRLSTGFKTLEEFKKGVIEDLEEQLNILEIANGKYIPPSYLEIYNKGKDVYGHVDADTILYMEEVEQGPNTNEELRRFTEQIDDFIGNCEDVYYSYRADEHLHYLPDLQLNHFIMGKTVSNPEKQMYFIDTFPPLLPRTYSGTIAYLQQITRALGKNYDFPKTKKFIARLEQEEKDMEFSN